MLGLGVEPVYDLRWWKQHTRSPCVCHQAVKDSTGEREREREIGLSFMSLNGVKMAAEPHWSSSGGILSTFKRQLVGRARHCFPLVRDALSNLSQPWGGRNGAMPFHPQMSACLRRVPKKKAHSWAHCWNSAAIWPSRLQMVWKGRWQCNLIKQQHTESSYNNTHTDHTARTREQASMPPTWNTSWK